MAVRFRLRRGVGLASAVGAIGVAMVMAAVPASASGGGFLGSLGTIRTVASTVPANGDINPYGVAVAPTTIGRLHQGDVLVSNFNNSTNSQGTGTTIVEIRPGGHRSVFASIGQSQVPGGPLLAMLEDWRAPQRADPAWWAYPTPGPRRNSSPPPRAPARRARVRDSSARS